jgi:hypothetical protein
VHCVDILRQQLICHVDTGILGQIWWDKKRPKAFPDFGTQHICRSFEAVRRWAFENQLPERTPHDFLKPPLEQDVVERIP